MLFRSVIEEDLNAPVVFVIGRVVSLASELKWFEHGFAMDDESELHAQHYPA